MSDGSRVVGFHPMSISSLGRCLEDAGARGVHRDQIEAELRLWRQRLERGDTSEASPLVGVENRFLIEGEYLHLYFLDRTLEPDPPDYLVLWFEASAWIRRTE